MRTALPTHAPVRQATRRRVYRRVAQTLYFCGDMLSPTEGSRVGVGAPGGSSSLNVCTIAVKKMNSSILARLSPGQLRGPAVINIGTSSERMQMYIVHSCQSTEVCTSYYRILNGRIVTLTCKLPTRGATHHFTTVTTYI